MKKSDKIILGIDIVIGFAIVEFVAATIIYKFLCKKM